MTQATTSYPVSVSVPAPPERFERIGVLFRMLASFLPVALPLFFLPLISAYQISKHGGDFHKKYGERYRELLNWAASFYAWMTFLSDEFPSWGDEGQATLRIEFSGSPSVGTALLRFIMVIPIAIFLYLVLIVSSVIMWISGIIVLLTEKPPEFSEPFQRKALQLGVRVLAYYGALVEEVPAFELEVAPTQEAPAGSGPS